MAKTFGISDIAQYLADHFGLNKKQSVSCTKAVLAFIKNGVSKGDTFRAVGFGTFKLVVRSARSGRNPLTGAQIKIAAKKVIRFKATKGAIAMPADYRPKPVVVKVEAAPKKAAPKKAAPKKAAPKKAAPKKAAPKKAAPKKATPKKAAPKKAAPKKAAPKKADPKKGRK